MPQAIAFAALVVSSAATTVIGANILYLGTLAVGYAGLAYGSVLLNQALNPSSIGQTNVPKPEDGTVNIKQSIPSIPIVLGKKKVSGVYVFIEQTSGTLAEIRVIAGHKINAFVTHYLHDEIVTFDSAGLISSPAHFVGYVKAKVEAGSNLGTADADVISLFPSIWTASHRGDALAKTRAFYYSPPQADFLKVFPSQKPEQSDVIEGHNGIYDPRTGTYGYTANLALLRLWHLTSPYGGKLSLSDMYMPDWIAAANVCDQFVTNRSGGSERRYHGGLAFFANSDPIEVGRILDEAGELVVYERGNGLIGVHPGSYSAPTITLTKRDIISFNQDTNSNPATTVVAVRGRYENTANNYATEDAATYGDPYSDDAERTVTLSNAAIQSHNHCQRLQKIKYIRRNAQRVSIVANYDAAEGVTDQRFIRVQYGPRLADAVVEITSKPVISLANMTVSFGGIILPTGVSDLYVFNAATEEGIPGQATVPISRSEVPVPSGFGVVIQNETLVGGGTAAYGLASWTHVNDAFVYELEWELTSGSTGKLSILSKAPEDLVKSGYLADGSQYRFRLRTWAGGVSSDWTSYLTRTATADPTAPGVLTSPSATPGAAGEVTFGWTSPNSANYAAAEIYINTSNTITGATLITTEYGPANTADTYLATGLSAGTKYGFIKAINYSGTASAAVATGSFVVT